MNEFALDLKVARRSAGFSQADCAHLLSVHPSKISLLEHGKATPSLREICTLSLVYGKSFEGFFAGILADIRGDLAKRLETLPTGPARWPGGENRQRTLNRLAEELAGNQTDHGSA